VKFRKKPVIIEAAQWFPGREVPGVREQWYKGLPTRYYVVTMHEQRVYLSPGDWVIAEPDGEHFYPCKPEVFAATYEPVEPENFPP
jgi:hypothetical protein